jgi:hypothetical protein
MSLDYGSLTPLQQRYVFAIDPQLDDLDSEQMDNFDLLCNALDSVNTDLSVESMDNLAIRCGLLKSTEVYENNATLDDAHMVCAAVDVDDSDGSLFTYLVENDLLEPAGFYAADNVSTPGYIHLQIIEPPGGDRVFTP